jgi:hypothetical protein
MTFIVRTRLGDIDVNPKNQPMGRRELLERARRLVKRAIQEGEGAYVFEKANGREAGIDVITGEYIRTGSPSNLVAAGLQKRGGAGAGKHHTRTRDVATGRARSGRHGGRAGMVEHENPDDFRTEDVASPQEQRPAAGAGGRTTRPDAKTWKAMSPEQRAEIEKQIGLELLADLQGVSLAALSAVLEKGGVPSYPSAPEPQNPYHLEIYSNVPDIRAAAEALKIPASTVPYVEEGTEPPWQATVVVDNEAPTEGIQFGLSHPDRAPRITLAEGKRLNWPALQRLGLWLRDGSIQRIRIEARRPGGKYGDPVAYPAAGDAIFLLSTLPALRPEALPETVLRAPYAGKIVEVTPTSITVQDLTNLAGEYSKIANLIAEDRQNRTRSQSFPALEYEAQAGYPSMTPQGTVREIERAARALFAPDVQRQSVTVRVEGKEPWGVQVVAKSSSDTAAVAQALGRAAELERDRANTIDNLLMLEQRDPGSLALLEGTAAKLQAKHAAEEQERLAQQSLQQRPFEKLGKNAPAPVQTATQAPTYTRDMLRLQTISDARERLRRIEQELGKVDRVLREKSISRLTFRGVITLKTTLSSGGKPLHLVDGVGLGVTVSKGQQLTQTVSPVAKLAPRPREGAAFVKPVEVYPRRDDVEPVAAMFAPTKGKPVRSVLIRSGARLSPGEVGSFAISADGKPLTVYVTAKAEPLNVGATITMLGGLGNFLEKLGVFPADKVASLDAETRSATALTPKLANLIATTAFEGDERMAKWLSGETTATALFLSPDVPAGATTSYGAGSGLAEVRYLEPVAPAAGKKLSVDEIEKLMFYGFYQDRPLDISPVKRVGPNDLMAYVGDDKKTYTMSFMEALARANKMTDKIERTVKELVAAVKAVPRNQRVEKFVDTPDMVEAARRAQSYGNKKDVQSAINRLVYRRFKAAVEAKGMAILNEIEAQDREHKLSSFAKLAEAARRLDPEAADQNVQQYIEAAKYDLPESEVTEEIERIRTKMLEPQVVEDPMMGVLLVAVPKADSGGRSRPMFEVVLREGVPYKGYGGGTLGSKIKAFERISEIGYVPSEMPVTKAVKEARKDTATARSISDQSALAAARAGEATTFRGGYGARGISAGSERGGLTYSLGSTVVGGKDAGGAPSFGSMAGIQPENRMDAILFRYKSMFPDEPATKAPMGKTRSASEDIEEARSAAWIAAEQAGVRIPLTVQQAAAKRIEDAKQQKLQATRLTETLLNEDSEEIDFSALNNPRPRKLRNPVDARLFEVLDGATGPEATRAVGIQSALRKLSENTRSPLVEQEIVGLRTSGAYLAALAWGFKALQKDGLSDDADAVTEMLNRVVGSSDFIKNCISSDAPVTVSVGTKTYAVSESDKGHIRTLFRAGPLYSINSRGKLEPRSLASVAALFTGGLRWGAWVECRVGGTAAETEALREINLRFQDQARKAVEDVEKLRALPQDELGNAARVLVTEDNETKVVKQGFILTDSSLRLLVGGPGLEEVVASISDARKAAEDTYAAFVSAALSAQPGSDTSGLRTLMAKYESAAQNLRSALTSLADQGLDTEKDPLISSLIEARVIHYLAGRTAPGTRPDNRDTRLIRLRDSVSRLLTGDGTPLVPLDKRILSNLGLPTMNYGKGTTLESRPSYSEMRSLVIGTTTKGEGKPASTSTLLCRPGNRAVREFSGPFKQYRPHAWQGKGLLNIIWLSPDGQLARLYRGGPSICILRRHPGESLQAFLQEVAENWSLWLTDPEHQRQTHALAQIVWLGQSGDISAAMYKLNTKADRGPLSRSTMAARMRRAGVSIAADGNSLVPPAKAEDRKKRISDGYILQWGGSDDVQADADIFLDAMQQANLIEHAEVTKVLGQLFGDQVGAKQAESAEENREAPPGLVVLSPPLTEHKMGQHVGIGGTGTLPSDTGTLVSFLLGGAIAGPIRIYDQSYTTERNTRLRSLQAALADEDAPGTSLTSVLTNSLAGRLIRDRLNDEEGPRLAIVAGAPVGGSASEVLEKQNKLESTTKGLITFSKAAGKVMTKNVEELLEIALSAGAPVLVVDTHDVPESAPSDKSGLALLARVAASMAKSGTLFPVVYVTPEKSTRAANSVAALRTELAKALEKDAEDIPIMYATYDTVKRYQSNLQRAVANPKRRNPRQREVRQVASLYMRTYPFLG